MSRLQLFNHPLLLGFEESSVPFKTNDFLQPFALGNSRPEHLAH